jgi:hypothetical protein
MSFCTVINCIDGRAQLPVISYVKQRFGVEYVDVITEAGPNLILAENKNKSVVQSILERVQLSLDAHHSVGIAISGHHDCAGNPALEETQILHIQKAVEFLSKKFPDMGIIGLWVDENGQVREIEN